MKVEDITTAVVEELTASCAECGITNDIIDKQSFACFSESPTYVTYRARLEGTSETDSGSLISLIEEWVSGGASIIVTEVLMTVDSECSVAISSLSEGECTPTQPHIYSTDPTSDIISIDTSAASESTNSAAIIGGVVAVILIVSIALTVIAVVFIMKIRRGTET